MLLVFQSAYVFRKEKATRVRVDRIVKGVALRPPYYLIGMSCTCLGMQKVQRCKHIKMWEGDFELDEVMVHETIKLHEKVAKAFGIEFQMPESSELCVPVRKIVISLKTKVDFDLFIGITSIKDKRFVFEIRRL